MDRTSTANGNGTIFSSSPQYIYNRSISTPSPSLPKAIPFNCGPRSTSVFAHSLSVDSSAPPCSAPVTFNRYINVSHVAAQEQASSPSSSWYARLSSSLKKSVLRRSTSHTTRDTTPKRVRAVQRRSVIIGFLINDFSIHSLYRAEECTTRGLQLASYFIM